MRPATHARGETASASSTSDAERAIAPKPALCSSAYLAIDRAVSADGIRGHGPRLPTVVCRTEPPGARDQDAQITSDFLCPKSCETRCAQVGKRYPSARDVYLLPRHWHVACTFRLSPRFDANGERSAGSPARSTL